MAILFKNQKGQVVAKLIHEDKILYKKCSKATHMLRSPLGWAFDEEILKSCQLMGVAEVWIEDKDTKWTYKSPLEAFFSKGILVDRGHGRQLCLSILEWKRSATK